MTLTVTPGSLMVRDEVVLLADDGTPVGTHDRIAVHTGTTPLHLAFSVHLFNRRGEVLISRRAVTKKTWPGVWTNSCCGHPLPQESQQEAVRRRVEEELGLSIEGLTLVLPDFRYRAVDASGVVENELCPVWVGRLSGPLAPDPAEVAELTWVEWDDLVALVEGMPALLSPWCVAQVPLLQLAFQKVGAA